MRETNIFFLLSSGNTGTRLVRGNSAYREGPEKFRYSAAREVLRLRLLLSTRRAQKSHLPERIAGTSCSDSTYFHVSKQEYAMRAPPARHIRAIAHQNCGRALVVPRQRHDELPDGCASRDRAGGGTHPLSGFVGRMGSRRRSLLRLPMVSGIGLVLIRSVVAFGPINHCVGVAHGGLV
jgi:hypothetical protein